MSQSFITYLQNIQKDVFGLSGISNNTSYSLFNNSVTINTDLYITGIAVINNCTILSNLNISSYSNINGSITINNFLNNINTNINKSTSILSNISISNNTTLNNTTVLSNLNINKNLIIYNNLNVKNNLLLNNNSIINGNISILSNLNILNSTNLINLNTYNLNINNNVLFNYTSILSNLNVYQNTILNSVSIQNNLNILNNSVFNNIITKNIISNNLFNNNISILSSLNILNNFKINNLSIGSLNVNNNCLLINNTTILSTLKINNNASINILTLNSNLYVTNNTIINNNLSCNSSLVINGNCYYNNTFLNLDNSTILSNLNISNNTNIINNLNILSNINNTLYDYPDNTTAINYGIPLWGFYRTGGIIKIRLNEIPPTMILIEGTTVTNYYGNNYIDPGVTAYDIENNQLLPYITSISISGNNILTNSYLISGPTTIHNTNNLIAGLYTITYKSTDVSETSGYINRYLDYIRQVPVLYLSGNSNLIYTYNKTNYIDPGVYSTSTPYLISFITGTTNLLTYSIQITGATSIPNTTNLNLGTYILTYMATNTSNITGQITRTVVLSNTNPTLYLSGGSNIIYNSSTTSSNYLYGTTNYVDLGVYGIDNYDSIATPYLTSFNISGNSSNLISSPIQISGLTTITNTSTLLSNIYILTYTATNTSNLIGQITRNITINPIDYGLIAKWLFTGTAGATSGSFLTDSINNYIFTNPSATNPVSCNTTDQLFSSGCASFTQAGSGKFSSLSLNTSYGLNLGQYSAFSFSYWFKITYVNTITTLNERIGLEFNLTVNSKANTLYNFYSRSTTTCNFGIKSGQNSSSGFGITNPNISQNSIFNVTTPFWAHMVLIYSKVDGPDSTNNGLLIYVNNVNLINLTNQRYIAPGIGSLTFASGGGVSYGPSMLVQDFRIYNRALTAAEVNSIYRGL